MKKNNNKALGRGLSALLGKVDKAYNESMPITDKQKDELSEIEDKTIIEFIDKLADNNFDNMEICLKLYSFLEKKIPTKKKNKNYKNSYVISKFNDIKDANKGLKIKDYIQLTANELQISINAVRNHIYKK